MRVLAISDMHGCSRALNTILSSINIQSDDLVITLGDYVDRGPGTFGVIERLLSLRQTCTLVTIRGNHDQMMLDARLGIVQQAEWLLCGGQETLDSYAPVGQFGQLVEVPQIHWDFLEKECVNWYETETHFFVHANVDPKLPLAEQPLHVLLWEKWNNPAPHISGKIMVCGHTAQRSGRPLNLGHAICLDTWVYGDGWLTCLEVGTGKLWQANQRGQSREGSIHDLANLR